MKSVSSWPPVAALIALAMLTGCSQGSKPPDMSDSIRKALDYAGLKSVSVQQDASKGVVTLGGNVPVEADKARAEEVAKSLANGEVVANQIAVLPVGMERDAKTMNADLDKGIEQNLDAALIQSKLRDNVKYAVKSCVVTLTGQVDSQTKRSEVARVAASVPNVQQVVNEIQVKNQKASSSE